MKKTNFWDDAMNETTSLEAQVEWMDGLKLDEAPCGTSVRISESISAVRKRGGWCLKRNGRSILSKSMAAKASSMPGVTRTKTKDVYLWTDQSLWLGPIMWVRKDGALRFPSLDAARRFAERRLA